MAQFTEAQKTEIVTRLAQFTGPARIVADFKAQGIQTDIRQVGSYDPTRPYFEAGDKWRELFDLVRKRYVEELDSIPSANKAFRINLLHEAALKARDNGNTLLMAQHLKQIAEDVGGALTNERKLGIDGTLAEPLSPEDKRAALGRLLDRVVGGPAPTAPTVETAQ